MKQALKLSPLLAITALLTLNPTHASPLDPPDEASLTRARVLVESMIGSARGPYTRIRWYCNDGSVLPPEPYACRSHGGGRQHAQFSADREALAGLGFRVGTIFATLEWEEFFDAGRRNGRLRELALERYLVDVADGWVLRRARYYRGRIQVEDETVAGTALLSRLYADGDWVRDNYLLAREAARTVPHGADSDLTRAVRRLAQDIAEADGRFEPLRIEIHTRPDAGTVERVRDWAASLTDASDATQATAAQLTDALQALFGEAGRKQRMKSARQRIARLADMDRVLEKLDAPGGNEASAETLAWLGALLATIRDVIVGPTDAATRMTLLDTISDLETEVRLRADAVLSDQKLSRQALAHIAASLLDAGYGSGYFSARERDALLAETAMLRTAPRISQAAYLDATHALDRAAAWAVQSVRYTFAEPLIRFTALDPRASGFVDDMLRSSPVLHLAQLARRLSYDSQQLAGISRTIDGLPATGMLALNPGLAVGTLRLLDDAALASDVTPDATDIVLIPQTVSELPRVGGIVTGGEGNLLSHVQLLARNFAIPNVSIGGGMPDNLLSLVGHRVVLAVDRAGSVVLFPVDKLKDDVLALLPGQTTSNAISAGDTDLVIDVPLPELDVVEPLPLALLGRELSGKVVGPKAGNLGELNRLFPGRVAPAIALPFGLFEKHMRIGKPSIRTRLDTAYAGHRDGTIDDATLESTLASIRSDIRATALNASTRATLTRMMAEQLGEAGSYGVFVRSDTNVEDLPGFTGAGLNETIPNVVGLGAQLDAIPRVWSSVLSPRAIAWRSRIMREPERIFASVLLMKSVPADKSGVLVTTDLDKRSDGLTVSAAWGVGGAVAGESAETVMLGNDGGERLLSEAKAPYRRNLATTGGVTWVPARDGAVLDAAEKTALRELARELADKLTPANDADGRAMPWDVEFGFVGGELTLFQVRPLVERRGDRAALVTARMAGNPVPRPGREVNLEKPALAVGTERSNASR